MYKEFDILRGAEFTENENTLNSVYKIEVYCDANDGDYMYDTVIVHEDDFEQNELYMLILSYVSTYDGKFGKGGHDVANNNLFPWLESYLAKNELLIFAGMCNSYCHSISGVSIQYYNEDGVEFDIELPNIDDLFETKEEFESYLNKLYNEYIKSGE